MVLPSSRTCAEVSMAKPPVVRNEGSMPHTTRHVMRVDVGASCA